MDVQWYVVALLSVCVAGQIIERFLPVRQALKAATVEERAAAIMYFRCTDSFHGKRKVKEHNKVKRLLLPCRSRK